MWTTKTRVRSVSYICVCLCFCIPLFVTFVIVLTVHVVENEANVTYQELDIPKDFPLRFRKFIPNSYYDANRFGSDALGWALNITQNSMLWICYNPRMCRFYFRHIYAILLFSTLRTVVLVATRDIKEGEELFSNYFTAISWQRRSTCTYQEQ